MSTPYQQLYESTKKLYTTVQSKVQPMKGGEGDDLEIINELMSNNNKIITEFQKEIKKLKEEKTTLTGTGTQNLEKIKTLNTEIDKLKAANLKYEVEKKIRDNVFKLIREYNSEMNKKTTLNDMITETNKLKNVLKSNYNEEIAKSLDDKAKKAIMSRTEAPKNRRKKRKKRFEGVSETESETKSESKTTST